MTDTYLTESRGSSHLLKNQTNSLLSIANFSPEYSLSELLPYDPHIKFGDRLIHGLKEYDFLLTSAEYAMKAVKQEDISSFDPLVGENMCQIRALKNCLIFSDCSINSTDLLLKIYTTKQNIDILASNINLLVKEKISLGQLLKDNYLEIKLTYNEIYFIKSFLLTEVKTIRPPKKDFPFIKNEYTDFKKLKKIKSIGTMFVENLIKKLRQSLSFFSVSFIKEISASLDNKIIMPKKFHIQHKRLHCLPCYWVTKILLLQALKSEIPITIISRQMAKDQDYKVINEVPLFFKPSLFEYQHISPNSLNPNQPSLVLLVNACRKASEFPDLISWKKELQQKNPINLILAYAASHRQYPDIELDYLMDQVQDQQFQFYKKKAVEWGCSITNPSLFFLSHAFCDKIKNIL